MKKNLLFDITLPRIEVVGYVISLLGFGLKCALQPGGDVLLLIGLMTLSTVYFIQLLAPAKSLVNEERALLFQGEELSKPQPTTTARADNALRVGNLGASTALVGILFKLLSWHGVAAQLLLGMALLGLSVLLLALAKQFSRKFTLVLVLGAIMLAVPAATLAHEFYPDDPMLAARLVYQQYHPKDKAAAAETQRQLADWRKRHR